MSEVYTSGKSVKTGSKNYLYLYILGGVVLLALVFWVLRSLLHTRTVNAHLLKEEIFLNEPLVYTDNTRGAKKWVWEFGNGDKSLKQNGSYQFRRSGTYIVRLTVDDELRQQFPVSVKDTVPVAMENDVRIIGPHRASVGEQIRLDAEGNANIFEWSFESPGRVDMKGRSAFHTYQIPGTYNVSLKTDKSAEPVYHTIVVAQPLPATGALNPDGARQEMEDDFKRCLQAIVNGGGSKQTYFRNYNHLLGRLCNRNENTRTEASDETGKKTFYFYDYCLMLTFNKNIVIDNVELTLAPGSQCVTQVTVHQHR
jgi:hypothetical protein